MDVRAAIEQAVAALEPGGQLVEVRELTGGVSANVFGLCIATSIDTTRRVVFRQHRDTGFKQHARRVTAMEYSVLGALHKEGFEVPEPYLLVDTDTVTRPFLVTEWIEGSTELVANDLPAALEQMAQFLVRLHSLDTDMLAMSGLDHIEDPGAALIQLLPRTPTGDRVGARLATGGLASGANRSALLHGDYWPGNIMWRHGRLAAVLDWEDARLGDPLADLATARVELLCQCGADAMEQFTAHYLAMLHDMGRPIRLDALPLWELYVSTAALSTMHAWNLEPTEEAKRRQQTERFFERAAREFL